MAEDGNDVGNANDAEPTNYTKIALGVVVCQYPADNRVGMISLSDWDRLSVANKNKLINGDTSPLANFNPVKARVLTRGTKKYKDYFHYNAGEYVVYIHTSHDYSGAGWYNNDEDNFVVGAFYLPSYGVAPPSVNPNVRQFVFPDGTSFMYDEKNAAFFADLGDGNYIKYERESGELLIKTKGTISLKGEEIWLN